MIIGAAHNELAFICLTFIPKLYNLYAIDYSPMGLDKPFFANFVRGMILSELEI